MQFQAPTALYDIRHTAEAPSFYFNDANGTGDAINEWGKWPQPEGKSSNN